MTLKEQAEELVSRTCDVQGGTKVTNCVVHMNMSLLQRPSDCPLCATDVKNKLSTAIKVNEWLNGWKDEAEKVLRRIA